LGYSSIDELGEIIKRIIALRFLSVFGFSIFYFWVVFYNVRVWDNSFRSTPWKLKAQPKLGLLQLMENSPNKTFRDEVAGYYRLQDRIKGRPVILHPNQPLSVPLLTLFSKAKVLQLSGAFDFKVGIDLNYKCFTGDKLKIKSELSIRFCEGDEVDGRAVAFFLIFGEEYWNFIPINSILGGQSAG